MEKCFSQMTLKKGKAINSSKGNKPKTFGLQQMNIYYSMWNEDEVSFFSKVFSAFSGLDVAII